MPESPLTIPRWPDVPLDQHLRYATHVKIECYAPVRVGRCGHQKTMMTEELYEMTPGAVTCADFQRRLVCRHGHKGWSLITVAGR